MVLWHRVALLLVGEGLGMVLHDVQSIIKKLGVRLRFDSGIIIFHYRVYIRSLTSWGRPDVSLHGVNGGGVGHRVGWGHLGLPLVVHAVTHVVVGVVPGGHIIVLLRKVQLGSDISLSLWCVLPLLVTMETKTRTSFVNRKALARGSDLVEAVLKNLVEMHGVLPPCHRVHLTRVGHLLDTEVVYSLLSHCCPQYMLTCHSVTAADFLTINSEIFFLQKFTKLVFY